MHVRGGLSALALSALALGALALGALALGGRVIRPKHFTNSDSLSAPLMCLSC